MRKSKVKKFIKLIKNKWLRQKSLTILLVVLIILVFVALNMWVQNLKLNPIDFTKEKIYSLSDKSKEEVAKVAVFLGSDLASYVSGQVIHVCGAMNC